MQVHHAGSQGQRLHRWALSSPSPLQRATHEPYAWPEEQGLINRQDIMSTKVRRKLGLHLQAPRLHGHPCAAVFPGEGGGSRLSQ